MLNLYQNIDAMNKLSSRSSLYPPIISIETSAICNLSCNKCPVGRERKVAHEYRFMDMNLYKKIIQEIRDYSMIVNLSYLGEPLINPDFFEYVRLAKESGLVVSFYSNGVALNREIIENIIKFNIDHICFSVDCLSAQYLFYSQMKNIPESSAQKHLESIIKNIELLCLKIKESKKPIIIQAIRMDAPGGTPETEYRKFWEARDVVAASGGVMDWGGALERVTVTRKRSQSSRCSHPYSLGIQSDGLVSLCSIDFNTSVKLGDVKKETIKAIYNGKIIQEVRHKLATGIISDLPCSRCGYEDYLIVKQNPVIGLIRYMILLYFGQWYRLLKKKTRILSKAAK